MLMAAGMCTSGAAQLALTWVDPIALYAVVFAVLGAGVGLGWALTNVATQSYVPEGRSGAASGLVLTGSSCWRPWASPDGVGARGGQRLRRHGGIGRPRHRGRTPRHCGLAFLGALLLLTVPRDRRTAAAAAVPERGEV
jgi:hypothetical protein